MTDAIRREKLSRASACKNTSADVVNKVRLQHKSIAKENRYRVVASRRSALLQNLDCDKQNTISDGPHTTESESSNVVETSVLGRPDDKETDTPPGCPIFCLYDVEQDAVAAKKDMVSTMHKFIKSSSFFGVSVIQLELCNGYCMLLYEIILYTCSRHHHLL